MRNSTAPSEERLRIILARQDPPAWGSEYVPGQLATREEAPPDSRPVPIQCAVLGRDLHAMSWPERDAMLLGMHLGNWIELNEGRMIPFEPTARRLSGHPRLADLPIKRMRGSVEVAEALGVLEFHPTIYVDDPERTGRKMLVPFPLLGDLLWFFLDDLGHYPVNWSVKARPEEFEMPSPRPERRTRDPAEEAERARARLAIEELTYLDADVPTVRVAGTEIPPDVANNLRQVYGWVQRRSGLSKTRQRDIVDVLRVDMNRGVPPIETLLRLLSQQGGSIHSYKCVLYQAIWQRALLVDLWEPIDISAPLHPQTRDPKQHYAKWFARYTP